MIIVTTLVIPPGGDAGPFNLYSDSDGYTVPFATNVSIAALQAGYSSTVPNDATIIRVISTGLCTNFIDLNINLITTTTTSSSSSTTTSTTTAIPCNCVTFYNGLPSDQEITYIDCNGDLQSEMIDSGATDSYCGCCGEAPNPAVIITEGGACVLGVCLTTTTTTTCPCYTWDIDATQADVDAGLNLAYINCNGDPTNEEMSRKGRPFTRCVQSGSTPVLTRDDSAPLEGSTVIQSSDCCTSPPPISSTTTTTTSNTFGPLIVQNDSVNLTVNSVTSLFAFISIPPTPPTTITTGTHEALVNAITVNVTSNIAPNCMKLYIGGSFIQQVTIVGTGAFQFDPLIVADTVEVKIVINDFACIEPA